MQSNEVEAIVKIGKGKEKILREIRKVIVGQADIVNDVITSFFAGGHCLITGVPGLAKTLLISSLGRAMDLKFRRIQFTPDLMPADITGTEVLEEDRSTARREMKFRPGPIFTNILLADEINRTPPKTQAALLEAMQERHVTVGEETYQLPEPFFVLATQNPIEQEGTYPLPEAQLDRFMFMIMVDYPTADEEIQIMKQVTSNYQAELETTLTGSEILGLQDIVRRVPVADHVYQYARDLARASRPTGGEAPAFINELVNWGAGPRASIYLILAGKARAILHGRYHVTTEDIREMAPPVLRHRIITTFNAEAAGITSDEIVRRLLTEIKPAVEESVA
jgi:MoxR-like ATPase